jgi:hypothetical protein
MFIPPQQGGFCPAIRRLHDGFCIGELTWSAAASMHIQPERSPCCDHSTSIDLTWRRSPRHEFEASFRHDEECEP